MRRHPALRRAALLAVAAGVALAGCGGDAPEATPSPAASVSPSVSPTVSPTVTTGPSPTAAATAPTGAEGGVVLGGEDLGVTRLGVPFEQAVQAVATVLGAPDEDPATTVRCVGADREVRWGQFVLAARDGRLVGWQSRSSTLQTPSGVAVGTPVSSLEQVYGDGLERFPPSPDDGPTFAVTGVDVFGGLSSEGDDAVVTSLFSSACGGP